MSGLISILLPDLRGGGAERISIDLAYEFTLAGQNVEFVLMQARGELLEEARQSFSVVDLANPRARALPLTLCRYLRRRRPGVLLAAMWPLTVIAPLAQRLSGHPCKLIVSEHGILSAQYSGRGRVHGLFLKFSMMVGYRLANARIGVSSGVVADIAKLSKLHGHEFHVIYNPVASRPQTLRQAMLDAEALWSGPKGARIVTVGHMKEVKNHPLLLRAFAQLRNADARLMFVGDGPEREALTSLAIELGVRDRVIFTGFHNDPAPFYKTADLFVLSSDYEGFGNVIVEALGAGLPIVSTDCPSGPREILDEERFGRLVPVGDERALAQAITEQLNTQVDRDLLRARAADFAPEIAARRYLDVMEL